MEGGQRTSPSRRAMSSGICSYLGSAVYGLLVFGGCAFLGFVIAPALGLASGLFAIDAESRGFFSLVTLKAVPQLAALSLLSVFLHHRFARRSLRYRALLLGVNVLVVWLVGASIALAILG